ncbi:MAG: transposase [Chloroflexi bacterium]|nr:transposase [Chloroflexota bacterium]
MKGSRRVKDEQGQAVEQKEYSYGYKAHLSLNAQSGLITSMVHTPGNAYDGRELPRACYALSGPGMVYSVHDTKTLSGQRIGRRMGVHCALPGPDDGRCSTVGVLSARPAYVDARD